MKRRPGAEESTGPDNGRSGHNSAQTAEAEQIETYITGPSCSGLNIALAHLASKVLRLLNLTNNSTKFDALISV
jgi:hypothetical protein